MLVRTIAENVRSYEQVVKVCCLFVFWRIRKEIHLASLYSCWYMYPSCWRTTASRLLLIPSTDSLKLASRSTAWWRCTKPVRRHCPRVGCDIPYLCIPPMFCMRFWHHAPIHSSIGLVGSRTGLTFRVHLGRSSDKEPRLKQYRAIIVPGDPITGWQPSHMTGVQLSC